MTDTMNKLFFRIGFIICGLFAMLSCGVSEMKNRLKDVESYIMERPDSALAVLDSMDRTLLTTDRLKAHHALLHAMALDKNYIDVTDDSLASVALEYYSRKGPKKYEARSRYYLGLSYFYAGDLSKAILETTKAEEVAVGNDSLYLGFVKVLQADIYSKTHNDVDESGALMQAVEIYKDIESDYYLMVAELRLAQALLNQGNFYDGESILHKLIYANQINEDARLSAIVTYAFMKATQENPDYRAATEYYSEIYEQYNGRFMKPKDYWAYAFSLEQIGRSGESEDILSQLFQIDSSVTAYYWRYRIEKYKGNDLAALPLLEKALIKNNSEVTETLKQSVARIQKDYYESQYREAALLVRLRNQMIVLVLSLSILLILLLCYMVNRYVNRQRVEREKMMEYVEEIKRQLVQAKDEDYPLLKKRFIDLYKSRFETIGTLCEQYLQNKDRNDVEKVMYQKMLLMIEDIRNDNVRKVKFESLLNSELDGIMQNFRNEMPKSKEWEVTMFSYLVAGFDATMISRLMDIPLNNVYAYKRRLKLKIEDKKPEHSDQFLEMIS